MKAAGPIAIESLAVGTLKPEAADAHAIRDAASRHPSVTPESPLNRVQRKSAAAVRTA